MPHEDLPLPDWFPEVSIGEMVYVRRDPRKNSQECWMSGTVEELFRSPDMPNLNVSPNKIGRKGELMLNVLHIDDPRLDDPNFMATATHPDAPGVDGVFTLSPTRIRQDAEFAALAQRIDDLEQRVRTATKDTDLESPDDLPVEISPRKRRGRHREETPV